MTRLGLRLIRPKASKLPYFIFSKGLVNILGIYFSTDCFLEAVHG
jgi:hypothetical protein